MGVAVAIVTGSKRRFSRRSPGTAPPGPNLPDEALALPSLEMKFLTVLSQPTVEGWGATSVSADPNPVLPLSVPATPPGTTDPDAEGFGTSTTPAWLLLDSGLGKAFEDCTSIPSPPLGC